MKNRGMGHIEMILAFVLFIGFLFFGVYFFNPLNTDRLLDSSVDYAYREIIKNVSYESVSYSVVINDTGPAVVSIPVAVFQNQSGDFGGFIILNTEGKFMPSTIQNIGSPVITFNRGAERYVKVVVGNFPMKDSSLSNGYLLPPGNYTISSSESKRLVTESGFDSLKEIYDDNYLELKKQFNLPGRVDFAFILTLSDSKNLSAIRQIPEGLEVIAKQERVEIINSDGDSQFADLLVKVW